MRNAAVSYDVIDANHRAGEVDAAFRPNQIFAVGGLPFQLLEGERAERIVSLVEEKLWTPLGLRSLAPGEPGYAPHYEGGVVQRDGAYHQGTVWPWLDRAVCRSLGASARQHRRNHSAKHGKNSSRRSLSILKKPDSVTFRKSPTPKRRTHRGVVRFRLGLSAKRCGWIRLFSPNARRSRTLTRFTAPKTESSRIPITRPVQEECRDPERPRDTRARAAVTV